MSITSKELVKRRSGLSPAKRALLEKRLQAGLADDAQTRIPHHTRQGPLPLSFAQQRLWFLDQLEPESAAYNEFAVNLISDKPDIALWEKSFGEIVRRHEILRTTFASEAGRPIQVIHSDVDILSPTVDLAALSESDRQVEARRLAVWEAQRPFDLARGPLVRVLMLRLSEEKLFLLRTMHHIVCDGWSMEVLLREASALYEAFSQGQPSPLPDLPIQYADYAAWQRQWLQGEVLERQIAYWKDQLAGALTVLELPIDRPRPPIPTYQGASQPFTLPASLVNALKDLSRREEASLFMTLLSAFKVLLYRYTGQQDIVVGVPIAGRNWPEVEKLIGIFINLLALRSDFSDNPSFRELLSRVREAVLQAEARQDLPFEALVAELRLERDMSRSPLVQVVLSFQGKLTAPLAPPSLEGVLLESGVRFDLDFQLAESLGKVSGYMAYNTDIFDSATIVRMLKHFRALLEGIVADPEQRVSDLPLLMDGERSRLLTEWNDTGVEYPQDKCIHELFEEQVGRMPDAVAVVFEDQNLTYRELNRRANQLAHHLRELGVGPEVLVGICLERSLDMIVGLYGILKAGGAYVPLDPSYPRERLAYMLEDARLRVLLTSKSLVSDRELHRKGVERSESARQSKGVLDLRLMADDVRVVCLDVGWEFIACHDDRDLDSGVGNETLAYMIYTSGSTGQPKGAMNTHGGIRNRLQWMQEAYHLTESDRVIQKTPFSFDVSVWEFFWPLMNGASLVVARPEGHKDSEYLVDLIVKEEITVMHFVPSMLQVFVETRGVEKCCSLKRVICSGETLPYDLQRRFFDRSNAGAQSGVELHNLYGPTEAAVDVTYWPCERGSRRQPVPIGRPIANTQIYLLDERLEPVPIGVKGELYIGGAGLARGYYRRAGLTAEKFVPNPFGKEPGERLYWTGDLARYLPDGNIEFLGRADYQVKIRGFRIELGEIETALRQHPDVRDAVALVHESEWGDKRLVAYVTAREERNSVINEMRRFLQDRLPDYMVPATFVMLEMLPLTPSGKIDRRALPAPEWSRPDLETAFVASQTETERAITTIWQQLLSVTDVGIHDNFFDLGGHSLLLVQMHSRLQEEFGCSIPIAHMFQYPTIRNLAEYLSEAREEGPSLMHIEERGQRSRATLRRQAQKLRRV
jgi:amino acid adenylation domain-containing protein